MKHHTVFLRTSSWWTSQSTHDGFATPSISIPGVELMSGDTDPFIAALFRVLSLASLGSENDPEIGGVALLVCHCGQHGKIVTPDLIVLVRSKVDALLVVENMFNDRHISKEDVDRIKEEIRVSTLP